MSNKKEEIFSYAKKLWISSSIFDLIVMKNLSISKKDLFLLDEIEEKYEKKIKKDLDRVKLSEPIEYIIGKAEFFSFSFFVDKRVLIPRNDTEIMVEQVLKSPLVREMSEGQRDFLLIDIWTGSWAIPISILKNSKIKKALAIDISKEALEVANINIKKHNLWDKINLLKSNLLEKFLENNPLSFEERAGVRFKNIIITANLPYIKNGDFENMSKETLEYEPNLALFWWKNTGFEMYEKLINQILEFLEKIKAKIILFIEIGFDQKEIALKYLKTKKLKFEVFKDNNKISRCVKIYFDF